MERVWQGVLQKMRVAATAPVSYWLEDATPEPATSLEGPLPVNPLIGRRVAVQFEGVCVCTACGGQFERVFDNGYCGDCVRTRADADICMMKPELCHFGDPDHPCRDERFGLERCFQPHYLYASLTSDVKVGITRHTNVPARWMDQGAVVATTLAMLPSRREVGKVEHALARDFKDRTHWMKMLRGCPDPELLAPVVEQLERRLEELGVPALSPEHRVTLRFHYPLDARLEKIRTLSLNRVTRIEGTLLGVKGQYWVFEEGVLNIRRHSGHRVEVLAA